MANNVNIFDKYGIKEVANVYFEALEDDIPAGVYKGDIVLFLDTLKVSTIETTAENVAAQGGWGNPRLVQWDYGKEINITLEDALMSLESLRFMLGGAIRKSANTDKEVWVHHTAEVVVGDNGVVPQPEDRFSGKTMTPTAAAGHPIRVINLGGSEDGKGAGARTQIVYVQDGKNAIDGTTKLSMKNPALIGTGTSGSDTVEAKKGDRLRIFWDELADDTKESAVEVVISPDTFPGTYKVVGDTFMRSEKTGKDEPFQFIINKAKVLSEVTITLEAEGDPSTFEMQLNVLRSNDAGDTEMMKLVRYNVTSNTSGTTDDDKGSLATVGG
jgi:hypothetical protein